MFSVVQRSAHTRRERIRDNGDLLNRPMDRADCVWRPTPSFARRRGEGCSAREPAPVMN